ncbi:helix-turn-helix domain-containing protein [Roseovarius sp. ZX-A-9]|uniref:helix-turn-helix domain-containing protein n=1 Tax=Roseovarius sp. ZX-A-9 TaxID=3014783 RepID=UPI0023312237|nr:helix-turn-helix domain-containing protein [Roseovarius sp. ZX-A-9]
MAESTITGTRIRERRVERGIKQTELAAMVEISPSYLNLIEHNRRRIGGTLLLRIARALKVEPQVLSHGAEAALIGGLREAAGDGSAAAAERDRLEEFAGRFPGWAQTLVDSFRHGEEMERMVQTLTDRLAHDPHLAESIHEVLSVVAAIRSAASILVETPELEQKWQARFHRNIDEDSKRLADGAKSLVRYLDATPGSEADIRSPQDELDQFLSENQFNFATLETGGAEAVDAVLEADTILSLPTARELVRAFLEQYQRDALRLPRALLEQALDRVGLDPLAIAEDVQQDLPCVFRCLASLPADVAGPIGLVVCDGSGAMLTRKPLDGFSVSRPSGACPLWPIYRVLTQPGVPLRMRVLQPDRDARPVTALAVTEQIGPARYNEPPLVRAYMLLLPEPESEDAPSLVGTSCRICPRQDCIARREPSVMQEGF